MTAPHLILALDTSTPRCALALGWVHADADELLVHEATEAPGRQASAELADRLRALMDRAGQRPDALTAVACGVGPGMFTGVRVAIATAKGIALGLGVPALAVSTLASVAASATSPSIDRLALVDARRAEVYAGHYRVCGGRVDPVRPDRCAPIEDVLRALSGPTLAVGPGLDVVRAALDAHPHVERSDCPNAPCGQGLWRASVAALRDTGLVDPQTLAASYLRQSYAELGIHKPKRPFVKSPFID